MSLTDTSSISSASLATPSAASAAAPASAPSPVLLGPSFPCEHCGCVTQFVGTSRAVRLLGVSRSTIYYWMERGWIHWRLLPSGRRIICRSSLSRAGHQ
jgi:predicted DNA-binding transcriptional regulator AlpA